MPSKLLEKITYPFWNFLLLRWVFHCLPRLLFFLHISIYIFFDACVICCTGNIEENEKQIQELPVMKLYWFIFSFMLTIILKPHRVSSYIQKHRGNILFYNDVIMSTMASQITSLTIVYSTVYSGADQRKHQSSASMAFVKGIRRKPMNSLHKGPVIWKMFPFDDIIMLKCIFNLDVKCTMLIVFITFWIIWERK